MLTSLKEGRDMLDKGIYSGFYGDIEKTIVKATPGADKGKAANTEQYLSHIGNIVIPRLKDFGGNDTVEELKYLQKVMAGTITIEEKAMRGILDSTERKLKAKMERLSKQAGTVGLGNEAALGLPSGTPVAPAPTVAPVTGGQPNREAIDAELRRRGIIR